MHRIGGLKSHFLQSLGTIKFPLSNLQYTTFGWKQRFDSVAQLMIRRSRNLDARHGR